MSSIVGSLASDAGVFSTPVSGLCKLLFVRSPPSTKGLYSGKKLGFFVCAHHTRSQPAPTLKAKMSVRAVCTMVRARPRYSKARLCACTFWICASRWIIARFWAVSLWGRYRAMVFNAVTTETVEAVGLHDAIGIVTEYFLARWIEERDKRLDALPWPGSTGNHVQFKGRQRRHRKAALDL